MKKLSYILLIVGLCVGCGNARYKNYVIEHADKIKKSENTKNVYEIDSCDYKYYTNISIRMMGDSSYILVFWGNRDSWLWNWKLDKDISVDIPHNIYKGKNVEKDIRLINAIKKL